jgi:hypothetical protein
MDTDLVWTQAAIDHFVQMESGLGLHIDQPVFQSWQAQPADMLPETKPGTLTNTAFQYLLPPTKLSTSRPEGAAVTVRLTDSRTGAPIADAAVTAELVDAGDAWGVLAPRSIKGATPAGAAYAILGVRANAEGVVAASNGEADLGPITFRYADPSSRPQTWRSTFAAPYRIKLSPAAKVVQNLPGPVTACGNAVVPVAPASPFTLEAPMSATKSADHAGYVMLNFFDRQCRPLGRTLLYFTPASRMLTAHRTDAQGGLRLDPASDAKAGSELRLRYDGDNATHRPTMAVVELR